MSQKSGQSPDRLRLTLRHLEVFLATAHDGSTRAAAERIARSQSAASSALVELESLLGAALFDRVGRRLVLNEHGRAFLPRAASLVESAGELEHLFQGQHAAPLRVAASMTIGEHILPPLLARWKVSHPQSAVQLQIANTTGVLAAVAAFDADIGFIEGPQTHADLVVREWMADEMVIVAAPGHPLAHKPPATRAALRGARWALRERGSGTREAADRWLLAQLGQVRIDFELGTPEAVKALVAAGDALALLPRHSVASALARGELVELPTSLPRATRRLAVVTHRERTLGAGGEAFLRYCFDAGASKSGDA
ncbi:transcriptional regulator, LysR family [Paracidovorax avenae ATCC 19860]|uniref:Transcriptional regulator, LysR family n=1 Tax=Paracidovorax avenae (strain ATCC 19860 / DSM 7227 / CCUG 15838 / JCM 20985 / LMG 2117 / NCPPB 1011) TaxID=643561 RepID=F0Q2P4_PARA1|nr:LysR family transcriptional regulator [Paracidovorax avenae]ADX47811.1 transcriptional regulator, LysR family [Paracidovorax avenae ATCC 19860]